jgi:hypothetical protein
VGSKMPLQMLEEVRPTTPPTTVQSSNGDDRLGAKLSFHAPHGFGSERRSSARFPLELPAELCWDSIRLVGKTANISSGGLLMTCDRDVQLGALVSVRLGWPLLQSDRRVVLIVHGEIIRRERSCIAILQRRYEFEVSGSSTVEHTSPSLLHQLRTLFTPGFLFPQVPCTS